MPKKSFYGKAFIDSVARVQSKIHKKQAYDFKGDDWQSFLITGESEINQTPFSSPWRYLILSALVVVIFSAIFVRLFHLQVVEGGSFRELADYNRIKVKIIHAPRGVIYDRNGKILAQNEPGFRLVEEVASGKKINYISRDEALKMEVGGDPRIKDLEVDSIRHYALGEKTAHILGYVSEINDQELKDQKYKNYRLGDKVGRGGIEETYEKILKGVDGGEIVEVDAAGNKLRTLRKREPVPGQNLHLTIDADLQSISFDKLKERVEKSKTCCAALVTQNPKNGQILSLVSLPSYNPKDITTGLSGANSPMLNRAIGGAYPPGSTYKIASALAGLESGKITGKTIFEDTGVVRLGPYSFANWFFTQYGKTEGVVDVVKALKRSNDTYFYYLGQLVGEKVMGDISKKLGFGSKLGIDIPGEVEGVIPDNQWKIKNMGEVWYPGDSLHMAIGQGFVLATPLQISNLISIIASDGKQFPPHLALKVTDSKNKLIKEFEYSTLLGHTFKQENIELIKKGLEEVPKAGGTAWPFFNFPVATAGKTGTAEFGDPKKTHAWYTSYGLVEDPTFAVTVLLEKGGEGSSDASPVVKEIMRWYYSPDKTNLLKDINSAVATQSATQGE